MNKINVVGSMTGFGLTDVEKMIIENADVMFAGTRNIERLNVNKKIFRPIKKLDTALDEIKNDMMLKPVDPVFILTAVKK